MCFDQLRCRRRGKSRAVLSVSVSSRQQVGTAINSVGISMCGLNKRGTLQTTKKWSTGQVKNGSYIVTLKQGVPGTTFLQPLSLSLHSDITHEWDTVFNGFAGKVYIIWLLNQTTQYFQLEGTFPQTDLDLLRVSSDIEAIEDDGIVTSSAFQFDDFVCHVLCDTD
jgi:hypothetical protein